MWIFNHKLAKHLSRINLRGSDVRGISLWKEKAKWLKSEVYTLYLAYADPRVPLHAKIFAAAVVGYALSPIDLIPDFIPVLGYVDDLILIPLGVILAVRMIPNEVLEECREKARLDSTVEKPMGKGRIAAVIILLIWLSVIYLILRFTRRFIPGFSHG